MSATQTPPRPSTPSSPPLPAPFPRASKIVLEVGSRRFLTTRETLEQSSFFRSLLSGRWDHNAQAEGSYFIDADPALFEHILRYLQHSILPIFYDRVHGHDHVLYHNLLVEAKYFGIDNLQKWLRDRAYLKAVRVKVEVRASEATCENMLDVVKIVESGSDAELELFPRWFTKQVYVCPRQIEVHRGRPEFCGRACRNARVDGSAEFEDEEICTLLEVRREVVLDEEVWGDGQYV